jgi:hypothetical protein
MNFENEFSFKWVTDLVKKVQRLLQSVSSSHVYDLISYIYDNILEFITAIDINKCIFITDALANQLYIVLMKRVQFQIILHRFQDFLQSIY